MTSYVYDERIKGDTCPEKIWNSWGLTLKPSDQSSII